LFEYVTKGHDVVRIRFQAAFNSSSVDASGLPLGRNEMEEYIKCRFFFHPSVFSFFEFFHVFLLAGLTDILLICSGVLFLYRHLSACEACWRMFDYDFVERLIVHLPGMNRIISHEDDRSPCFFGP
jgi:hypothetical protein